jgi:acetylornithine deacetylase/succinyl-diaminopimelate desuccinylase-like protein
MTGGADAERARWLDSALARIVPADLASLDAELTALPSPTGAERPLAEALVGRLRASGLEASVQPLDDRQANAIGRSPGSGGGPRLLLYAPLDTVFTGDLAEDQPWLGQQPGAQFRMPAVIEGDLVVGLGAENPKAYLTCVVAAAEAVVHAGIPLRGDLLLGLAAGGAPVMLSRPDGRATGFGAGCTELLAHGPRPDFAIVAKPGYTVSWEEVGSAWVRVRVHGAPAYAGIRHTIPYRNPIVTAADVIQTLEAWFADYTAAHTDGFVAPQAAVGAISAGGVERTAFSPATCDIYVDVRLSPRSRPDDVERELREAVAPVAARHPGARIECEVLRSHPGTRTDPDSWIVRSLIRGWEAVEQRQHQPFTLASGFSDACIFRSHGIATARLGLPVAAPPERYAGFSMGVASVAGMARLTACLVHAIVDTCTRERHEVGLA